MRRQVALIIESSSSYGRDLLAGIVRFMRMHDTWSVFLEQRDLNRQPPSWLADWHGDGIISRATTPRLVEAVAKTGVPLVELSDRRGGSLRPHVRSDDAAISQLAAEHLLERGFRRFAFCGFSGEAWSRRRQEAFVHAVGNAGGVCDVYNSPWLGPRGHSWDEQQRRLMMWLSQRVTPCGIMACNDVRGQHVLDACRKLTRAVPEELAVVGVDNDELLCRVCSPPLSSVIPNAAGVGFRAAELLARLMDGQPVDEQPQIIEPLGVATRQSSDVVAIDDRQIAAALHYIREHACRGLSVEEVVQNCSVSRSTLERQVRKYLGRTPQQEIRHVQIQRARELLLTTDLPAERLAALCGFDHPEYLMVVFKRLTGMTTSQFRKQAKP